MDVNSKKIDFDKIKPYGDTLDDGKMQFSFTLPVNFSEEAKECAKRYLEMLGFEQIMISSSSNIGKGFTFFVAYGVCNKTINFSEIKVTKATAKVMTKDEIVNFIETTLRKTIVIVGACIESDAHTVGIDAILNMKGVSGHKGLESYHGFEVYNMGAQVPCEILIEKAKEVKAHALLISQIVTQRDVHIKNMVKLVELLEAENLRHKLLLIAGGPRISHELAIELGYDAGFGTGSFAEDVGTFIVQKIAMKEDDA